MPLAADARRLSIKPIGDKRMSQALATQSSATRSGNRSAPGSSHIDLALPNYQQTSAISSLWGNSPPPLPPDDDMLFVEFEQIVQDAHKETRDLIDDSTDQIIESLGKSTSTSLQDMQDSIQLIVSEKLEDAFERITDRFEDILSEHQRDMLAQIDRKLEDVVQKIAESLVTFEKPFARLKMADSLSYSHEPQSHGMDVSFGTVYDQSFAGKSGNSILGSHNLVLDSPKQIALAPTCTTAPTQSDDKQ